MNIVNLTPHTITVVVGVSSFNLYPSGDVARVATVSVPAPPIDCIPTCTTTYGDVVVTSRSERAVERSIGLPAPVEGTIYIVSGMVAAAAPRLDVFSPGDLIRDDDGRPVGCKGLRRSC